MKRIGALAPLVFQLHRLLVAQDDKGLKRSDVEGLLKGLIGYCSIVCGHVFYDNGGGDDDGVVILELDFVDLIRVWMVDDEEHGGDYVKGFFPFVSDGFWKGMKNGCEVRFLAGVVMFEALLSKLCLEFEPGVPRVKLEKKLQGRVAQTITGSRTSTFWMKMREREIAGSSDSVSVDIDAISPPPKQHTIRTHCGYVSVAVYGDREKPALITYPDLALNYVSCFQGLLFCAEASSLFLHNFCIYHISPPGHELGAAAIDPDYPILSVDDLADQIAEVLNYFGLSAVMCMGATAGAYILTLFAIKYRQRVLGLILISPLCKEPSWSEWLYNKFMSNLLYFYGTCGVVKEMLLKRYFSKDIRGGSQFSESDIVTACRRSLDERQSLNVWRFLEAINGRPDISEGLSKLHCRSLIFVGNTSLFHSDALHMTSKLDRRLNALVEVQACGSIVTEEQPHAMLIPIEYFLMGYGLYRPSKSVSPTSPLSPSCIAPELFSPESMGLKLKPIKTRIPMESRSR